MAGSHPQTPIVVVHEGGLKFSAQIGAHRVLVDQPFRGGGEDAGPSPIELLGASLGTCVAFYVHQFFRTRSLSSEGLRVEVTQRSTTMPSRIGRFAVRVILPPDVPEQFVPLIERVARGCPAHNTLAHGAEVAVEVETTTAVAG